VDLEATTSCNFN